MSLDNGLLHLARSHSVQTGVKSLLAIASERLVADWESKITSQSRSIFEKEFENGRR